MYFRYVFYLLLLISLNSYAQQKPKQNISFDQLIGIDSVYFSKTDSSLQKHVAFCSHYFSELNFENIKIHQRKQLIPLTTTPSFLNFFRKKSNWKYKINISTRSIDKLEAILFKNLSFEGQLGVLGHEFSHVADFESHSRYYLLKVLFLHLNRSRVDSFEFNTDLICINHGMGYQLYAWSKDVNKINVGFWVKDTSKTERYMYPATICNFMNLNALYKDLPNHTCQ